MSEQCALEVLARHLRWLHEIKKIRSGWKITIELPKGAMAEVVPKRWQDDSPWTYVCTLTFRKAGGEKVVVSAIFPSSMSLALAVEDTLAQLNHELARKE